MKGMYLVGLVAFAFFDIKNIVNQGDKRELFLYLALLTAAAAGGIVMLVSPLDFGFAG